ILDIRHRVIKSDNSWRWMLTRASPIIDSNGNIEKWLGTSTDIDECVQIETKLSSTEERLKLLIDSIHIGVWSWDISSNIVEVDDNVLEMYESDRESFGSLRNVVKKIHPDDIDRVLAEVDQSLKERTIFDTEFRTKDNGKVLVARGKISWDD